MKYLKTNEEYNKEDLSLIEEEIIQMMYSITDEYQSDSSKDWMKFRNDYMTFNNIILENEKDFDNFFKKIIKISKIVKRLFNIDFELVFKEIEKYSSYQGTFVSAFQQTFSIPNSNLSYYVEKRYKAIKERLTKDDSFIKCNVSVFFKKN